MKRHLTTLLLFLGVITSLTLCAVAYAAVAAVPDVTTDPAGFFQVLFAAIMSKNGTGIAAIMLFGLMALLRWEKVPLVKWVPFLGTRMGGWILLFVTSFGGALGNAWLAAGASAAFSVDVLLRALYAAGVAVAGWEFMKDAKGKKPQAPTA